MERELVKIQMRRNEQYFNSVFKALMKCRSSKVLIKMLKVLQYYSDSFKSQKDKERSSCWSDLINADSILWLLNLIIKHIKNKYLCCLASLTLLGIVENHQIIIDVHEQAIKKAFNRVFLSMENFEIQESTDEE